MIPFAILPPPAIVAPAPLLPAAATLDLSLAPLVLLRCRLDSPVQGMVTRFAIRFSWLEGMAQAQGFSPFDRDTVLPARIVEMRPGAVVFSLAVDDAWPAIPAGTYRIVYLRDEGRVLLQPPDRFKKVILSQFEGRCDAFTPDR